MDTKCAKRSNTCEKSYPSSLETGRSQLAKEFSDSVPAELVQQIEGLSFRSIRVELSRRRLPTTGLREDLRRRLLTHVASKQSPQCISVPAVFPSLVRPPHFDTVNKRTASVSHIPQGLESQPASNCQASTGYDSAGSISVERLKPALRDAHSESVRDLSIKTVPAAGTSKSPHVTSEVDPASSGYSPIVGVLRLRAVWVCGERDMRAFWRHTGPLGKASLSRSAPCYFIHDERSWRGRAARQLLELEGTSNDAPSDDGLPKPESFASDFPRADLEHIQLTLVEAYYAAFVTKALLLQDEAGNILADAPTTWRLFCSRAGMRFPQTFVAYCRYRAAGWIPRSGLKYGTDWVLYPASAKRHTHSSFCVVLRFRDNEPRRLERTWVSLQNRIRLIKNVSKTLIIAEVITTPNVDMTSDIRDAFRAVSVSELTVDRWVP